MSQQGPRTTTTVHQFVCQKYSYSIDNLSCQHFLEKKAVIFSILMKDFYPVVCTHSLPFATDGVCTVFHYEDKETKRVGGSNCHLSLHLKTEAAEVRAAPACGPVPSQAHSCSHQPLNALKASLLTATSTSVVLNRSPGERGSVVLFFTFKSDPT